MSGCGYKNKSLDEAQSTNYISVQKKSTTQWSYGNKNNIPCIVKFYSFFKMFHTRRFFCFPENHSVVYRSWFVGFFHDNVLSIRCNFTRMFSVLLNLITL